MRNLVWYRLLGLVMILALALWSFAPAAEGPDKAKQGAASLDYLYHATQGGGQAGF